MGRNNHQKVTSEWIPVSERLPEAASERIPVPEKWPDDAQYQGGFHPIYPVTTKYGVTEGWYDPDCSSWYFLCWLITAKPNGTNIEDIDFIGTKIPEIVKVPHEKGIVLAWMPTPEPYKEQNDDI